MDELLIYDAGMHNGDDTAYYLNQGFRVIAIEADPALVNRARDRFADAIAQDRLTIINRAIAAREGLLSFYVNEEESALSSLDPGRAASNGKPIQEMKVQATRFRSLLARYGVPYYLKIDIEGYDHLCIADLSADDLPRYISFENSPNKQKEIEQLVNLGYRRFKFISQVHFLPLDTQPDPELQQELVKAERLNRLLAQMMTHSTAGQDPRLFLEKASLASWQRRMRTKDSWQFAPGSSGPFAEGTRGRWQTLTEIMATLEHFDKQFQAAQTSAFWNEFDVGIWADFHARL